jgi:hypothetical protein
MVSTVESVINPSIDWNTLTPYLLSWNLVWKVYIGSCWPNFPLTSTRLYLFFLIKDPSWTKQLTFKSQFSSSSSCQCQDITCMSQLVHAHSQFIFISPSSTWIGASYTFILTYFFLNIHISVILPSFSQCSKWPFS